MTYRVVRFYQRDDVHKKAPRVLFGGITLEEARAYCSGPERSSKTATSIEAKRRTQKHGPWFDGYQEEVAQ